MATLTRTCRLAIVTQGYFMGGGVPAMVGGSERPDAPGSKPYFRPTCAWLGTSRSIEGFVAESCDAVVVAAILGPCS